MSYTGQPGTDLGISAADVLVTFKSIGRIFRHFNGGVSVMDSSVEVQCNFKDALVGI
jgi:hypothetical protein